MEQCLKIALSVVFLSAYLQAIPVCELIANPSDVTYDQMELGFNLLRMDVKCGPNVTFISPTNVDKDNCSAMALKFFKDGLKYFKANCNDPYGRIDETEEHMQGREEGAAKLCATQANYTQCQWSVEEQFGKFVNDFESLFQLQEN